MLQRLFDGWWVGGDTLRRGDTIALLRGDTFRVVYGRSGGHLAYGIRLFWGVATQPGLPIVITAYGPSNGQPPLITGTWRLSDSARAIIMGPDGIVKVAKPFGSHRDVVPLRIFHKGTPLPLARFPNDTMLVILGFRTARDLLHADTIITRGLDNVMPSSVGGAVIWAPTVADFVWGCSKVVGLSKDTLLTLRWYEFPPERGARFYLEGKREFLDKPGEWYYDEQTDTLYLWPPALPFQPHEYEVMLVGVDHVDRTKIHRSRGLELGVSYDTLPDFPVQSIIIENLRFSWLVEGILLLGVKDITIRNCEFTESFRGIWNFLGENLLIRNNRFHDICHEAIGVHGRPPRDGVDPRRSMTRRAYVEHNTIRRTGLGRRWAWQTLQIDSARFWLDDRGIALTTNIDSVIARYNTIDGVGHVGIAAYLTHLEQWDRGYQGTLPFVIERNLITNFCMQSSDCGGILTIFYCRNGVVRNNILVKGANSDKSHHAYIMRPRAMGLYADAWPHDMLWEGNTVIGTDVGCTIYYGGGAVKNVRIERNTVYGCRIVGAETVTANGDVEECVARGNVFFGPMHGAGAVAAQDHYRNGKSDRFAVVDENWYVLPTYAPAYVQWTEEGKDFVYGFGQMRRRTSYEQSPLSRWLEWVQLRAWDTARVKRGLIRNSGLDRAPVPIWPFGGVRMEWVASSPLGVPARMVWCPDSVRDSWNGFFMVMDEPFYTAVTETSAVYRWSLGWASNRQKEYWSVWWPRTIHPNTGDTIIIPYH
ncbi:MAG: right-handed parallel beta-helix repeat-containing protein, partial [Bacteroidota bacterium]|nr:right-handed parallel beta-helix repeat-containing protein [Bacteroidota bacterium]